MKVNIVTPALFDENWIMRKIIRRLTEELKGFPDLEVVVSERPDPGADINHYGLYLWYNREEAPKGTHKTAYITHVDDLKKLADLFSLLQDCDAGICMSHDHLRQLVRMGCPESKLCSVRIGVDHFVRKRKITLAFPFRLYSDGRKNVDQLLGLLPELSPEIFRFKIIGDGWDEAVAKFRTAEFEVDWQPEFSLEAYRDFFADADYALYLGRDEGAIGMVDAADAGVRVIATRQGYHLDLGDGIFRLFDTGSELRDILLEIQSGHRKVIRSVENWTWKNFAAFHYQVWKQIMDSKPVSGLPCDQRAHERSAAGYFFQLLTHAARRHTFGMFLRTVSVFLLKRTALVFNLKF